MPSAKKQKKKQFQKLQTKPVTPERKEQKPVKIKRPATEAEKLRFALIVTGCYLVVAIFGMFHHEMWRDEHQAWLVARDAHSLPQLLQNMRYEGNPALWHLLLFFITRFTHNPMWMQVLHLTIAGSFIFIFNRYSPIRNLYKVLFSFGYFALYEYAIISRSYGLGVLLLFIVCALYKNRVKHYLLIGVVLALLANVTIYMVVIGLGVAGIMFLDYIFYQEKNKKLSFQLLAGLSILIVGVIFSLYQIIPTKDNSFPAGFATRIFDYPRFSFVMSRLFSTYFYVPSFQDYHFWNTNIFSSDKITIDTPNFSTWLSQHNDYAWAWLYMPFLSFVCGILIFLRKPLMLLFYTGLTLGLLSVYFYTGLLHYRYCGHLLIALIICYWISEYYPEKNYQNILLRALSNFGRKLSGPFLILVLAFNVIGAIVAYAIDFDHKFSRSKDVSEYIQQNKLDKTTMLGETDFIISPMASYLDTKIYYTQMNDFGSFCIWNNKRSNEITFNHLTGSIDSLIDLGRNQILLVQSDSLKLSFDGKHYANMQRAMIRKDLKLDFLTKFEDAIQEDERYYLYLVQKSDTSKVDLQKYPLLDNH